MSEDTTAKKDLFDPSNSVRFEYVKFENIGDKVSGTYVGKIREVSAKYGYTAENYILVTDAGEKVKVSGRAARKSDGVKVIFGMESIPKGAYIGFIYDRDLDTGKGNPAKIVEVRYGGEKRPEVLEDFQTTFKLEDFEDEASGADEELTAEGEEVPDFHA